MKYTLIVLALVLVLIHLNNAAREPDLEIPAFVKTMKELHQGPPRQPSNKRVNVETRWITQKLDNFDDSNNATWKDRILINADYFKKGSPIFIYLGGEWEIKPDDISSGHLVDIAKKYKGVVITTEHRFFGQSIPIRPLSTENLKYQTVNQALADVNNVIKVLKTEDKYKRSKVVISGCSYSATMAVLFKKLYPDVAVGSWASSAPLKAKVDFKEYMEVVGKALTQLAGDYCYDLINNATAYYEDLFDSGNGEQAKKELNLCDSFDATNEKDQWQIFSTIANIFAGLAQYQKPENYDLAKYCSVLRNFSEDDSVALSKFVQWRLNYPKCVNTRYQGTVDYYKWAMDNYDGSGLAWTYQTCREFGWFQSSESPNQPFGSSFPATLYTDTCHDVFGSDFAEDDIQGYIKATNDEFGGIDQNIKNLYMTHGGLDPWSKVGAGKAQGATIIPQASHCSDLGSIRVTDSPGLTAAKKRLQKLVKKWLA
ncbi:putative serine protease F56F10.1 [Drosophila innubila]|uniref:putative serine protease F56F10.1 n=1 Tax=Drosophila innubila TaxID=198719 RepID=UPI00148E0BD2|nr:putative serine protease F56F10.1 [Drosophila innubila]